ncbi:MAG: flagellar hook-basal body complex protein FliE [Ilumatobacter sp.]|jgi:flagellar hook-basal body complex protein FliE
MSISPILPVSPFGATAGVSFVAAPTASTGGSSFADSLTKALDNLSESHNEVDRLSIEAATGDLSAVHDFTIAAAEAQMLTQLTVEVRNKAVEAFNDIMRMQV